MNRKETIMEILKPGHAIPAAMVAFMLAIALILFPDLNVASAAALQGSATPSAPTLDPAQAALATFDAVHTETAATFTAIQTQTAAALMPSPDVQSTIDSLVTALFATEQAATAATAAVSAFTPVARNADWTPTFQTFDGVDMALVPIGCFDMGSNDDDSDEKPVNQQCFEAPFWIDKTEVTNAQYGSSGTFSGDNRPREGVNWFEARDFCEKRSARLPTEREWEYAARGPDNFKFPWGNDFVANNVVYDDNSAYQTVAVGSRPAGVSWVGAFDLSGNVWEWVSTIYQPYPYKADDGREVNNNSPDVLRGVRGGSFDVSSYYLRAAVRLRFNPPFDYYGIGFRCVRSF
jgi:formylglycine-generating enzyme required for sulfatase activity